MLTDSRDIIRRLEREEFCSISAKGSHHKFWYLESRRIIIVPHPRRDIPIGTVKAIYKQAGWPKD